MSKASRFLALLRGPAAVLLIMVPACLFFYGCDDDDFAAVPGLSRLTFNLDIGFATDHANQPVELALVRTADGMTLATRSGMISPTSNPAFRTTFGRILEEGVDYEVHYWIDSNTGGGTAGVCDAETIDHQWNWRFAATGSNVDFTLLYDADRVEFVCDTFTP